MFYEVRFHGRGGQGAVMAAQALAVAASHDGYSAIAFPFFGAERRGAPVLAFTRFGEERLRVRTQVYEPHFVVVLDESLVETVDVLAGLRPGGMVLVNTTRAPDRLVLSKKAKSATVDATTIALKYTKQAALNTAMHGAIAKATGLITLEGDMCSNCLLCWFYCPEGSITGGEKIIEIHYDYCKGCGVCAAVCVPKAIHMEREVEEEVKA